MFDFRVRSHREGDAAVIEEVFTGDCYELKALAESGYSPSHIIDIGAHIGCFTVLAHSLFPGAEFTCYEPNKESFELLKQNTGHIQKIKLVNAAVHSGENLIFTDGEGATGGGFVTTREKFAEMAESKQNADHFIYSILDESVLVVQLNEVLPNTFLKIDCEGSEFDIFGSMKPECAKNITHVVGEYHVAMGDVPMEKFKELVKKTFPHLTLGLRREAEIELFYCRK